MEVFKYWMHGIFNKVSLSGEKCIGLGYTKYVARYV